MTIQDRIRELDQRYVPVAAARTRAGVERLAIQRTALAQQRRRMSQTKPSEIDERFAGNRLLALVHEIPQLGFIVIAAVFLAGTVTAVVQQPTARPAASGQVADDLANDGLRLGPDIGQTTSGYERSTTVDLARLASTSPTSSRLALVTFSSYQTPQQVVALLNSYEVRRVYLRAAAGGPEAAQVPYDIHGDLAAALQKGYAAVAQARLAVRDSYLGYVATTENDKAYQADYAAYAASTGREVIAYQRSCACVFTAVVEAPARELLAIRSLPAVRAVQLASEDAKLTALVIQPLAPETKGLVTKGPVTQP